MNAKYFQELIVQADILFEKLNSENNCFIDNDQHLDLLFYSVLKKLKKGENFPLSIFLKVPRSCHYKLVQLFIEYGLYEQLINMTSIISLEHRCLKLIFDTFKDRLIFSLNYIKDCFHKLDHKTSLGSFSDLFNGETNFNLDDNDSENFDELLHELKKIDFNENLTRFSYLFNKIFSVEKYRTDDFFKARKPVPFILKNYPHYIFKICETSKDFTLYDKIIYEKNSFLSDILFVDTINNSSSNFYESISVASLHKLVRIFGIDFTIDRFRSVRKKSTNLVIDLFIAQSEIKRSRTRTGHTTVNSDKILTNENTALCISGQLRGGSECLPFWLEKFSSQGFRTFISTWENIGYPTGAEANRLFRMIPKNLHSHFPNTSVDEFKQKYERTFNVLQPSHKAKHEIENLIKNHPGSQQYIEVLYNDETYIEELVLTKRGPIPKLHLNQIKMFYNMKRAADLLHAFEKKNLHEFEWVIWTRPDFKITKLDLTDLDLFNYVYTSRISDEGRMLDYCILMKRSEFEAFTECYHNLISAVHSPIFGYNHGPRLITDVFLTRGYSALEIPKKNIVFEGLKAWQPSENEVYSALLEDLDAHNDCSGLREILYASLGL